MKKKQFDTNIIFRTKKEIKDKFKTYCDNKKTTVSKVLNSIIIKEIEFEDDKEKYFYVGKGHTLYGYYVTQKQYELFNELYNKNTNKDKDKECCDDVELSLLYIEITNKEINKERLGD